MDHVENKMRACIDGELAPAEAEAFDEYVTDYKATSGSGTRWLCLTGGNCEYGDRAVLRRNRMGSVHAYRRQ